MSNDKDTSLHEHISSPAAVELRRTPATTALANIQKLLDRAEREGDGDALEDAAHYLSTDADDVLQNWVTDVNWLTEQIKLLDKRTTKLGKKLKCDPYFLP
jgi:hypothetical protein